MTTYIVCNYALWELKVKIRAIKVGVLNQTVSEMISKIDHKSTRDVGFVICVFKRWVGRQWRETYALMCFISKSWVGALILFN